jgi:hypothetical protein
MNSLAFFSLVLLGSAPAADTTAARKAAAPSDSLPPAAADSTITVTFGGFVDSYVAFDAGRPRALDRSFTTQAARHGEFNVNLAYVDVTVAAPRVRGRLALQAGTSVQSNYAGEPRVGSVSGPELGRLLQEAYAGYEVRPGLWIDGGVFYSNVGMEGWVSRDNPIYTRSLVADYSPYYSSGVRATWQATSKLTARLDVVNGWQIISESNEDKTLGARLDYAATSTTTVSWYGLAGNEPGARLRLYNGLGLKTRIGSRFDVLAEFDVGRQEQPDSAGANAPDQSWYGGMLIGRWAATSQVALVVRVERYVDTDQVIIATGTPDGFRANGGSLGMDVRPGSRFVWRSEARVLAGDAPIFPDREAQGGLSMRNLMVVTSMGVTF